jgi:hypothetical protein
MQFMGFLYRSGKEWFRTDLVNFLSQDKAHISKQ